MLVVNCTVMNTGSSYSYLQLASPDTSEVEISLPIIIDKNSWIDAVAPFDWERLWPERPLRLVANCHSNAKNALFVASWKIEVVFAMLVAAVRRL